MKCIQWKVATLCILPYITHGIPVAQRVEEVPAAQKDVPVPQDARNADIALGRALCDSNYVEEELILPAPYYSDPNDPRHASIVGVPEYVAPLSPHAFDSIINPSYPRMQPRTD